MFTYRADVLRELERHGVRPTPHTDPEQVRALVRDIYKYEIRQLRERARRQEFPRAEYASRVDALRRAYPVLALQPAQFLVPHDVHASQADGAPLPLRPASPPTTD